MLSYSENFAVQVDDSHKVPERAVTFLGVRLDDKLNLNSHTSKLCKEASEKISALYRIPNFLSKSLKTLSASFFFYSHFCKCPFM